MVDDLRGDVTFPMTLPAYVLTKFATRDTNTDALELCDKTDIFTSRTDNGICLALFTDPQAAESYRDGRNLAAGFEVTRLDSLDLLCVLSRMGEVCGHLTMNMCPKTNGGELVGIELARQTLRANLIAAN